MTMRCEIRFGPVLWNTILVRYPTATNLTNSRLHAMRTLPHCEVFTRKNQIVTIKYMTFFIRLLNENKHNL